MSITNLIVVGVAFILGIPMVMNGGFYIFGLIDDSVTLVSSVLILFLESYIIAYYFGIDNLNEICANKTGFTIPKYVYFSWKILCPSILFLFIFIALAQKVSVKINKS